MKYVALVVGSLLFLASSLTLWLITKEFIIDKKVNNQYVFDSLSFIEEDGEQNDSIEKLYELVDSPPYREIPNVSVTHTFVKKSGDIIRAKTYLEYLSEINNETNTSYKRTYHFYSHTVEINEHLLAGKKMSLVMNDKIVSTFPVVLNLKGSLNLRYGNVGFVHKTNPKTKKDELVVVIQQSLQAWDVYHLRPSGEVMKESFHSITELRKKPIIVNIVNLSGAHDEPIGYYTQFTLGYPAFYFPIFFPLITFILSITVIIFFFKIQGNK
ncbi:hypothetical protein [Virgibacillus sp. MG-45]|uniref:hypothetical protein n=1 Tax=Virgibacillus sp. MG-45 TaxID=3102791 RepID=UPI002ED86BB3